MGMGSFWSHSDYFKYYTSSSQGFDFLSCMKCIRYVVLTVDSVRIESPISYTKWIWLIHKKKLFWLTHLFKSYTFMLHLTSLLYLWQCVCLHSFAVWSEDAQLPFSQIHIQTDVLTQLNDSTQYPCNTTWKFSIISELSLAYTIWLNLFCASTKFGKYIMLSHENVCINRKKKEDINENWTIKKKYI